MASTRLYYNQDGTKVYQAGTIDFFAISASNLNILNSDPLIGGG
jgi:hypothetical protein